MLYFIVATAFASYNPASMGAATYLHQVGANHPALVSEQRAPLIPPVVCEQVINPNFCKGPAAQPGSICSWQEDKCETVEANEEASEMHEEHAELSCELLSNNQLLCEATPGCHFEEFECKTGEGKFPEMHSGIPPQRPEPATHGGLPSFPPAGGPQPAGSHGIFPGAGLPGIHGLPPNNPPPVMMVPETNQPSPFLPPPPPVQPVAPAFHPQPLEPLRPLQGQLCESLPETRCFGPAAKPGDLCVWDAEDLECIESSEADVEVVCKNLSKDPKLCDQQTDCFWDAMGKNCLENKFGENEPATEFFSVCSKFQDVTSCASESQCFWDTAAGPGFCVNLIQAENVCRVLNTPQHCSTNPFCHWRADTCVASRGLLRKAAAPINSKQSVPTTELLFGVAAVISGLLCGVVLAAARSMCAKSEARNEDYRDIMLEIDAQVSRQV